MKPHSHKPVQHRDGKQPWCNECGLNATYGDPKSIFNEKESAPMVDPVKYVRKPFEVDAVEVTEENIEEAAEWCQGTLESDNRPYIKVRVTRPLNERQTKAYPGDWILYAGTGFKVYTAKAFHKTFERLQAKAPEELRTVSVPAGDAQQE